MSTPPAVQPRASHPPPQEAPPAAKSAGAGLDPGEPSNPAGAGFGKEPGDQTSREERRRPQPALRWYESWIVRSALIASMILFLGYAVAAFFAYESIDSIARLAHDEEIEKSLSEHLETIKQLHQINQLLISERLAARLGEHGPKTQGDLEAALLAAGVDNLIDPADLKITAADSATTYRWVDRDHLEVPGFLVELGKGKTFAAFKAAEDIRQRYQLVGVKLAEEIRPTIAKAAAVVLFLSFILLASIFIVYAQRFRARTFEVMEGFSTWSEKDTNFRFAPDYDYKGELRLITYQFNAMADEVEANRQRSLYLEKIASWQIIARKLAHEIKNPLTPIQMMVSQLKRRYRGDDQEFLHLLDEAQSIISEEVAGLRRMVDTFSNFARLPQPSFKPTDIIVLCKHAVELEKQRFPHHNIIFRSALLKAIAGVDEDLLRQVMINLVKNAGEASGERPANIIVGVDEGTNDYLITVRDDGPGIPPEHQTRVFEAYFTTKHTGPNPGMGLGLAVCQKIVIDHGGAMTVKSRPQETVFTVRIPRRKKD